MKNIFIIITMLLLISCGSEPSTEQTQTSSSNENVAKLSEQQLKNAGIEIGKLSQQAISSILKLNGKVDVPPQNAISISVPLGGYLKSTNMIPGTQIRKGDVLATMEDVQYIQLQQDYLTAKAQFSYNESEYNRQRDLNQSKATSDKVFEQTKATYETQNILMKSLEQKLRLIGLNPENINANNISKSIAVLSPINGYVSSVNANIGKYINNGDVLFELVDPSNTRLVLTVFEKDIAQLSIGQKLYGYTNANPEKKYPCTILLISQNLADNRSAQVHCKFEQQDKSLLPGMFMNADVEVTSSTQATLPNDAIVRFENKHYVFVDKGANQFEMIETQVGNSENGYTTISINEDLKEANFATKGAYTLLMTLKNVKDDE